ncbi:NADH-ubiquinone oxidoreductase chain 3 [Platanthera guangdongensis]|uniref:NADH-ubiquinone oxidoreductase chain 3 n=1 Tax=Platanthera guangdongensis TaxID=2320717 RepID=A0ABR2N495_9ASPA
MLYGLMRRSLAAAGSEFVTCYRVTWRQVAFCWVNWGQAACFLEEASPPTQGGLKLSLRHPVQTNDEMACFCWKRVLHLLLVDCTSFIGGPRPSPPPSGEQGLSPPTAGRLSLLVSLIQLDLPFPFASNSLTYPEKLSAHECGSDPSGDAKIHFDIRFYPLYILFIFPNPEVTFSSPWEVPPNKIDLFGSLSMMAFFLILMIGSLYKWKSGATDHE